MEITQITTKLSLKKLTQLKIENDVGECKVSH